MHVMLLLDAFDFGQGFIVTLLLYIYFILFWITARGLCNLVPDIKVAPRGAVWQQQQPTS